VQVPRGKGTGLVEFHDIRNERYLAAPRLAAAAAAGDVLTFDPFKKSVFWRAYLWEDQGSESSCTSAAMLHYIADGPVSHRRQNPIADRWALYREIQKRDIREGRNYGIDGGATIIAAIKTAVENGWVEGEYVWAYTLRTMVELLHRGPLYMGLPWYPSMFRKDANGLTRVSGRYAGDGHAIVANGRDHRRGWWRLHQSWGDGYWWITDDDLHRLVREGGEVAFFTEVGGKLPPLKIVA
jgi:hypothetical protein